MIKRKLKQEQGQSLVEFLFILPLFFLILGALFIIFQQQARIYQDLIAHSALSTSAAHFAIEERQAATWSEFDGTTEDLLDRIAMQALNPSSFFKLSIDVNQGVFAEKKAVHPFSSIVDNAQTCSGDSLYHVLAKDKGEFTFTTCAGNVGYDVAQLHTNDFNATHHVLSGRSLYYPQRELTWFERPKAAINSVYNFMLTPFGQHFQRTHASLLIPDHSAFNARCLMNPFAEASDCNSPLLATHFNQIALDGAALQVKACFAEAALSCAPSGPGVPVCLAAKAAAIFNATQLGSEAWVCPTTNSMLKATYRSVQTLVFAYSLRITQQETALRSVFLFKN
jgi:hypothetical protein